MSDKNANETTAQSDNASKNDQGKPDLSLMPLVAEEAAARAFMVGEKKYGRYNYYKGHKASQLIAALSRHAKAFMEGEENDPKDGQPHLGSVIACAAMLLQQQKLGTLIDDRYKTASTLTNDASSALILSKAATKGSYNRPLSDSFMDEQGEIWVKRK